MIRPMIKPFLTAVNSSAAKIFDAGPSEGIPETFLGNGMTDAQMMRNDSGMQDTMCNALNGTYRHQQAWQPCPLSSKMKENL